MERYIRSDNTIARCVLCRDPIEPEEGKVPSHRYGLCKECENSLITRLVKVLRGD